MLHTFLSDPNFAQGWHIMTNSQRAKISLLHKLQHIKGCPLGLYDEIIGWTKELLHIGTIPNQEDNIIPVLRTRKICMEEFEEKFTLEKLQARGNSFFSKKK